MLEKMSEDNFGNNPTIGLEHIHEFVRNRINEVKNMSEIVKFHTVNKYLIMSHSPNHLIKLGNIVANHEDQKFSEVLDNYKKELEDAIKIEPTIRSHYNTIQHIFGHFSADFTTNEKSYFLNMLQSFKEEKISISEVLKILKESTVKYDKTYLIKQTYFLFFTDIEKC